MEAGKGLPESETSITYLGHNSVGDLSLFCMQATGNGSEKQKLLSFQNFVQNPNWICWFKSLLEFSEKFLRVPKEF